MRKAKNDPGLHVGDKIRIRHAWYDETGMHTADEFKHDHIVSKVSSRFFYTEGPFGESGEVKTRDGWKYMDFQKEGDVWIALYDRWRKR